MHLVIALVRLNHNSGSKHENVGVNTKLYLKGMTDDWTDHGIPFRLHCLLYKHHCTMVTHGVSYGSSRFSEKSVKHT